jgi:hypothetical protein
MSDILRVTPSEIRERVLSGKTLLICAYDSEEKFQANHLEGALSLAEFKSRLSGLARDTELVFYCG